MPAPSASLATEPPTWLLLTVVLTSVVCPNVLIPPPAACANGRWPLMQVIVMSGGHGSPESIAVVGATRLPVMTLFVIVTVAPGEKFAAGGTEIPPPTAITPGPTNASAKLECVTPPVMVTPLIETVGSPAALKVPIVITGPLPVIVVAPAPAPLRLRFLSIVKPPLQVPAATT